MPVAAVDRVARLPERPIRVPPRVMVRTCPGSSSLTPANTVCGAMVVQNVKVSSSPIGSNARGIERSPAKIAFTSLANHSRPRVLAQIERPDSQPVAREHQRFPGGVPQRHGELAVEAREARSPHCS